MIRWTLLIEKVKASKIGHLHQGSGEVKREI